MEIGDKAPFPQLAASLCEQVNILKRPAAEDDLVEFAFIPDLLAYGYDKIGYGVMKFRRNDS